MHQPASGNPQPTTTLARGDLSTTKLVILTICLLPAVGLAALGLISNLTAGPSTGSEDLGLATPAVLLASGALLAATILGMVPLLAPPYRWRVGLAGLPRRTFILSTAWAWLIFVVTGVVPSTVYNLVNNTTPVTSDSTAQLVDAPLSVTTLHLVRTAFNEEFRYFVLPLAIACVVLAWIGKAAAVDVVMRQRSVLVAEIIILSLAVIDRVSSHLYQGGAVVAIVNHAAYGFFLLAVFLIWRSVWPLIIVHLVYDVIVPSGLFDNHWFVLGSLIIPVVVIVTVAVRKRYAPGGRFDGDEP